MIDPCDDILTLRDFRLIFHVYGWRCEISCTVFQCEMPIIKLQILGGGGFALKAWGDK